MGWTFRFLEQLEDDLRDAAARERVKEEGKRGPRRASGVGSAQRWPRVVAASVAVLVIAGAIGAIAQHNTNSPYSAMGKVEFPRVGNAIGGAGTSGNNWSVIHGSSQNADRSLEGVNAPDMAPDSFASGTPAPPTRLAQQSSLDAGYTSSAGSVTKTADVASPPVQQDLSKIVRTGTITVELPDGKFPNAQTLVSQYAAGAKGYVLSSTARGSGSGTFVLRIPAARFDSVMAQLEKIPDALSGGSVLWQNSTSQDVTAEFVDSGAQLQILKAEKAATLRYLKNAGSLSQAIQFRNQAFNIQGEIDKLQGRLDYLSNQVSLATLTVNLREVGAPSTHKPGPVEKPSLVRAWNRAVSGFLGVLSAVIVGLGFLIPLAILAALVYAAVTLVRRRRPGASSTP